jgi:hypothetical protein
MASSLSFWTRAERLDGRRKRREGGSSSRMLDCFGVKERERVGRETSIELLYFVDGAIYRWMNRFNE